ncbi:MAG: hypothetical protein D6679_08380 [Candidatus Hydrogenedentota bacterium]|nr:MAG: hypothetical protein D6679_08380 [Candidatus Hydrogenedentota bacterium]
MNGAARQALPLPEHLRPVPVAGFIPRGFLTLLWKEIWRFLKVINQTVLAPVVTNCLYLAVFGVAISRRASSWPGISYMEFLVPGLVMMGLIQNSFQNSSSTIIIAKYQGTISDLLVVPMRPGELAAAFALSGMLRGLIVGVATYLSSLVFIPVRLVHPFGALGTAMVIGVTFASLGAVVAIKAKDFDEIARIQHFLLLPLVFLGGVFFSAKHLPGRWANVALFNPIFHMIDAFRHSMLGRGDLPLLLDLAGVGFWCVLATGALYFVFLTGKWLRQ